jgi:hypothetical protein
LLTPAKTEKITDLFGALAQFIGHAKWSALIRPLFLRPSVLPLEKCGQKGFLRLT